MVVQWQPCKERKVDVERRTHLYLLLLLPPLAGSRHSVLYLLLGIRLPFPFVDIFSCRTTRLPGSALVLLVLPMVISCTHLSPMAPFLHPPLLLFVVDVPFLRFGCLL